MEINWSIKHYSELSIDEFHELIQLRIQVFIVEQNCPYNELDGKDKESFHILGLFEGKVIATARIIPKGISYQSDVSIGRFVVHHQFRGLKLGNQLMNKCIVFINQRFDYPSIRISAQKYLEVFYNSHGFQSTSIEYLEDAIPHVEMFRLNH